MARTYRHGRPTIGVLAGWQFYWTETPLTYLEPIFRGACLGAHDLGCNLMLACGIGSSATPDNPLRPAWPVPAVDSDFVPVGPWNTDGLIVINPLHSAARSRYLQDLITTGHPIVFIGAGERGPTIVADNRTGTIEAMQHLVEHGHRAIAFIAGSREDMDGDTGDRLRAYHDAVEMHGLLADPRLVMWGQHMFVGGRTAMQEVMISGVPFTAVLASNDESALGAMEALRQVGRRIPQDVAIIGFDDRPESVVQEPPLSCVHIPLRQMGYRAVALLCNYLTGKAETIDPARIATRLVPRASCGCDRTIVVSGAAALPVERQGQIGARASARAQLALAMAAPVLRDAQGLPAVEIEALCRRLVDAFHTSLEQDSPTRFSEVLDAVLSQAAASGDDVHTWQAALSILGRSVEEPPATSTDRARDLLDQARFTVSRGVQRQLQQHVVDQRWTLNRLGVLTASLLAALDEPMPESYRRDVEHIYANAQHLGGLIGDVLDLASSSTGQLRLATELVDLGDTLHLVAEIGRQLAHHKGLTWRAELPDTGPWIWGDRTRLRQIVLNLVYNAIKFTACGEVRLDLESDAGSVTVAVHDTGLGIPLEEQAVIFDEFRRSERSQARGYRGLGLGLAICQRLIELHGGTIGVRSFGAEGAGSTFYFTLPTVQPPGSQVSFAISSLTAESVLLLTHHAGSGQRLQELLAGRGLHVHMAFVDQTSDWLSQLVVTSPGVIVVDVSAASDAGWNVLKAIKGHRSTRHLPVMFCTLSADGGSMLEVDYLTKPIEPGDLTQALDQQWPAPQAARQTKTILVVDDDPGTLEMHARIVLAHSPAHQVLTARNGREALDVLQREQVDLVLLDLMMPELDGFAVLEAMREREAMRDVPAIVITGQVLTEDDIARLNQGVATVLSKGLFSYELSISVSFFS